MIPATKRSHTATFSPCNSCFLGQQWNRSGHTLLSSSEATKVMARPLVPNLPARPTYMQRELSSMHAMPLKQCYRGQSLRDDQVMASAQAARIFSIMRQRCCRPEGVLSMALKARMWTLSRTAALWQPRAHKSAGMSQDTAAGALCGGRCRRRCPCGRPSQACRS